MTSSPDLAGTFGEGLVADDAKRRQHVGRHLAGDAKSSDCITISFDFGRLLKRLWDGHIFALRHGTRPAIGRGGLNSEEIELSATARSVRLPETKSFNFHQTRGLRPLSLLIALALSGCGDKAQQQAAPPAPSVTVAQPTKRTVTDWDEFTGRFEAVEEVQVRARVGGFVDQCRVPRRRDRPCRRSALRDRSAPVRGGRPAGRRPACGCARQGGAGQARTRPRAEPGPDQRGLRIRSSTSAARPCRRRTPPRCRPKAR